MPQFSRRLASLALSFAIAVALLIPSRPAFAQRADSFIVVDAGSGRVLNAMNPDQRLYPASMTKIMTLYLTFEALSQGRLSLRTELPVSELAASQAPSKLGLRPGGTVAVETCIYAAVTLSANDCAMVLAEGIGGSEAEFARMMTSRARSLGMMNTNFDNPNGLPDDAQITTARDMAILAEALIQRFPRYYPYFATRVFTYNGIQHANHNHLMSRYPGMDGIKTGFIRAAGFNLTASAVRNHHRLIAVVFGGTSAVSRDNYMAALLDDGFRRVAGEPPAPATPELRAAPADGIGALAAASVAAPVPPQPPEARTGQVNGVALSEATDEVDSNESNSPPRMPSPAAPALGEVKTVTPAPLGEAPMAPAIAAATTPVQPPAAPQPHAVASAPIPPQEPVIAEGDADFGEPEHVLIAPPRHRARMAWRAEIGTFSSKQVSEAALQKAIAALPAPLRATAKPVSQAVYVNHRKIYKAELSNLNQLDAKRACSILTHCLPVKS